MPPHLIRYADDLVATFSGLSFHMYSLLLERGLDSSTVVAVIAMIGPSQVAGRIAIWGIAERASVRSIGKGVVLALPIALVLLLLLPSTFASLVVFAAIFAYSNDVQLIGGSDGGSWYGVRSCIHVGMFGSA